MVPQAADEMREEEVLACAFQAWFYLFKDLTFKSEIIPLSEDFVRYLLADGIHVPGKTRTSDAASNSSWGSGGDSDDETTAVFDFPELEKEVRSAIQRLNGKVLPKLNWSAPKDAHWIQGTLKCTSPTDVFTLLKASDFISHDLCNAFDHCKCSRKRPEAFTLVLRRWHSLHESSEFRAFVRDGNLIAISQRQTSGFFEHLLEEVEQEAIRSAISSFFEDKAGLAGWAGRVRGRFPLSRFAFDVYVDIPPRRRVWLVDFSPWGASTEPCLFDWSELSELHQTATPLLRVVRDQMECHGKLQNFHQIPLELAELNSQDGLNELLEKAEKVLAQKSAEETAPSTERQCENP
eukprot:Skav206414  [mRNA]  locus=scaffold292:77917:79054:+ [translate_table: standard]